MVSRVKKNISFLQRYISPKFITPFFVTLFIFLGIKQFVFDFVFVQSPGMDNTLRQGDMVFVTKLFSPKKNDIVRISLPLSNSDSAIVGSYTFKRIVGAPGDTVEIRDARLLVNGVLVPENDLFLHNYIAKIKTKADSVAFSKAGVSEKYLIDDSCVYLIPLTEKKFTELKAKNVFFSLVTNSEDSLDFDSNVFPYNNQFKWNEDFYGPLYIPKKGDTLMLDSGSVKLYKRIIVNFEGNTLQMENDEILVNEIQTNSYVVKKNYYFVTGDNFDNSVDSRNWGFIPENKIKAKVSFRR
jgi:signal peptidase I